MVTVTIIIVINVIVIVFVVKRIIIEFNFWLNKVEENERESFINLREN